MFVRASALISLLYDQHYCRSVCLTHYRNMPHLSQLSCTHCAEAPPLAGPASATTTSPPRLSAAPAPTGTPAAATGTTGTARETTATAAAAAGTTVTALSLKGAVGTAPQCAAAAATSAAAEQAATARAAMALLLAVAVLLQAVTVTLIRVLGPTAGGPTVKDRAVGGRPFLEGAPVCACTLATSATGLMR
jgi:hypothetical protein